MSTKYIVNNVTGQTINGNLTINGDVIITGNTNTRPYKVYTALLNQSGDGTTTLTNGTLDIGKLYEITNYQSGDDFTNVANVIEGTINTTGCKFIATGTTPDVWANSTELTDTSAPVATVLENTLGGTPVWTRVNLGYYECTLSGTFVTNKTFCTVSYGYDYGNLGVPYFGTTISQDLTVLYFKDFSGNSIDIQNTNGNDLYIQIKVYN